METYTFSFSEKLFKEQLSEVRRQKLLYNLTEITPKEAWLGTKRLNTIL